MRDSISIGLWASVALFGCGPGTVDGPSSDAGSSRDGGTTNRDGGAIDDDAGPPRDGAPELDAGEAGDPGPDVDRTDPRLHEFTLDPTDLDPDASDYISDQFAQLNTRTEPLGKLVVFLPGANNTPGAWRDHGRKLAEFGFHVVIPHYNNAWGSACSGQPGSCNADTRWEALTGEDTSSVIVASRADSAEGRVIRILQHLTGEHPGGDWGYYLDGDALRYARVIIAGISHGASSTGLWASRRTFWRAVMHSGGWGGVGDDPMTPISEYYGLSHTEDEQHPAHLSSWEDAGMLGSPTSLDGASPPFGDAHQLITSAESSYPHCSVAVHDSSPRDGMAFVFEPAWRHLYGVAALAR
jgi:hypothetical protein